MPGSESSEEMTTATLARGPPPVMDDDMDDDDLRENSPGHGRNGDMDEEHSNGRNNLMIDDGDGNSDDEAVDYSGSQTAKSTGTNSSDGEGDGERDTYNGSVESYDAYNNLMGDRNGRNGSAAAARAGASRTHLASQASPNGMAAPTKNGKSFVCDICMKTFSNAANMRRHRVRHSGIKPFECRFCQKRFFRKDHMREHMNHKHNNTQVQMECYFCQQVFDKEKDLFQHVTRDHEVNPRELHCQYCSFSATTIGRFLWHMTTSHPRKNSHYADSGSAEGLSMAPYPINDNDYDAADSASPALQMPATSSRSGGKRQRDQERDYDGAYGKADSPVEHSGGKLNGALRYYGGTMEEPSSVALQAARKKYVSILPALYQNDQSDDGNGEQQYSSHHDAPQDLSSQYAAAAAMFNKNYNNGSVSTAQLVAQAKAAALTSMLQQQSNGNGNGHAQLGSSSNRRKSKAPVRMTADSEESEPTGNGIKREHPSDGNGEHYSSMLEEVMSHQNSHRSGANNQPEDLSVGNLAPLLKRSKVGGTGGASVPSQNSQQTDAASRDAQEGSESCQKCPYCLITYPDNVMYLLHKMLHNRDHPFKCNVCHNQYPNRYEFYAHVVNHRM